MSRILTRVKGQGTLCPACSVPGKRVPLRTGGAAWYVWTCPECKATGTTRDKDPRCIVWSGIKEKPEPPTPLESLEEQILAAKGRIRVAWRDADRTRLPDSWTEVEKLEKELVELVRKRML